MDRIVDRIALLFSATAVIVACEDIALQPEEDKIYEEITEIIEDEEKVIPEPRKEYPKVAGIAPVSGKPLTAILDGGLTPLTFGNSVKTYIAGYRFTDTSAEWPDLFCLATGSPDGNGFYLCKYLRSTESGSPVYDTPEPLLFHWDESATNIRVASVGGSLYAVVMDRTKADFYVWSESGKAFGTAPEHSVSLTGIDTAVFGFEITVSGNEAAFTVVCDDGSVYLPDVGAEETLYDSANIFLGNLPYTRMYSLVIDLNTWTQSEPAAAVGGEIESFVGPSGVAAFSFGNTSGRIVANCLGGISYVDDSRTSALDGMQLSSGESIDNRCWLGNLVSVDRGGECADFFTSGEGISYLYRFSGNFTASGAPVYEMPVPVMMSSGDLFAGTFSVPNVVDWDLDNVLDIVAGTSDGRIAFFRNYGTNEAPAFGAPQYLKANGREVCVRSGYYELNGPMNAAYGYMSPVVFDWNQDGVPDILYSSNATRIELLLNNGRDDIDCLKAAKVIRMDGLDLWGRWKVRPAVTEIGGKIYIAILDEDDALHLFRKGSLTNVINCGKVSLRDGMQITGHRPLGSGASATEQGDAKMQFTDWDGDGDPDLLVGVTSVASWPSEMNGIPYSLGTQNMQVMILENVSEDSGFVFDYPRLFQYQGSDLFLGAGSKAPVECTLGDSRRGSNMLIGTDDGKLWFFARHDLSEKRIW